MTRATGRPSTPPLTQHGEGLGRTDRGSHLERLLDGPTHGHEKRPGSDERGTEGVTSLLDVLAVVAGALVPPVRKLVSYVEAKAR